MVVDEAVGTCRAIVKQVARRHVFRAREPVVLF